MNFDMGKKVQINRSVYGHSKIFDNSVYLIQMKTFLRTVIRSIKRFSKKSTEKLEDEEFDKKFIRFFMVFTILTLLWYTILTIFIWN